MRTSRIVLAPVIILATLAVLGPAEAGRTRIDMDDITVDRFFSTDWLMLMDHPRRANGWAQLDTTLRDAGGAWANLFVGWENLEASPVVEGRGAVSHTYRNLPRLAAALKDLKAWGYSVVFVLEPNMIAASWSAAWRRKVAGGDDDAQRALYETMKKLAKVYHDRIEAWQIDQEVSDVGFQVPWAGPQAYARMLRAAYRGIKDGYAEAGRKPSDAFVFFGEAIYGGWIAPALEYQVATYGRVFCDGLSPHLFRTRGPEHDQGYRRTRAFTGTMVDALTLFHLYGRDLGISWDGTTPIGLVQTPYSTYATSREDLDHNVVTFEQQANYRVRKAVIELTLGYVWSGWSEHLADWNSYGNPWTAYWGSAGIIKNRGDTTGAPPNVPPDPPRREKKAWWALNTLGGRHRRAGRKAGVFRGAKFLSRLRLGDTQHGYRFLKADGTMVTALWDADIALEPAGSSKVSLTAVGKAAVIGRDGDPLSTGRGKFVLDVGPAPRYVIGTLVEPDRATIRKISNDRLPAVRGFSDAYVIDVQTEDPAVRIEVTVPPGWSLPQTGDRSQRGYVTVEPGPGVPSPVSIRTSGSGLVIGFAPRAPMPSGGTLRIYYGDVRGQAMLLDPGLNGVLADQGSPRWTPQCLAPPDHAYHKPARNSIYQEFLGYGFDRAGGRAWRNGLAPKNSIYADRVMIVDKDRATPWVLRARAGKATHQVKVYLASENPVDGSPGDPYLRDQVVRVNGRPPDHEDRHRFDRAALLMFSAVPPQDGLISVMASPVQSSPPDGPWVRAFYGVDIWPSGIGVTPGRAGESRFVVKLDGKAVRPAPAIRVESPTKSR